MAQSSSVPGTKLKVRIKDELPSTEGGTAVLESPSLETQLVDFNCDTEVLDIPDFTENMIAQMVDDSEEELVLGDTEVLDIPDFTENLIAQMVDDSEEEVVLDSDDEEMQRNKVFTGIKGLSCDGPERTTGHKSEETYNDKNHDPLNNYCNLGLMRRGSTVAVSKSVDASCLAKSTNHGDCTNHVDLRYNEVPTVKNGISRLEIQTIDTNIDAVNLGHSSCVLEPSRLSYIESQEPKDSSEAALDFVDHYLSVNNVNLPRETDIGNLNKLTSPPALSAKGSRNLAMRANFRTKASDSRAFDWDDNQPELMILGWKSHRARSVSVPQPASYLKFQVRKVDEKCKDIDLNLMDSRLIMHKSNQISEVRNAAENASRMQSCKELGKHLDAEPLKRNPEINSNYGDVPDLDVGFDTQMAAEAIEALLYAPLPSHNANTEQGLEKNILENSSKCENVKKVAMDFSFIESGSFGSEITAGSFKRTKRSTNKLSRNKPASIQNDSKNKVGLDLSVELTNKVRRGKSLTDKCTSYVNPKSRATKKSSKVITRKVEEEFPEKENIRYIKNPRSSKADDYNLLGRIKEKVTNSPRTPPVARWTGLRSSFQASVTTKDRKCDYGGMKRSGLDTEKLWGGRRKRAKLGFESHVKATKFEANHNKETSLDITASMSNLKSNLWIFPKRKRTGHYVSHISELSTTFTSSTMLDNENFIGGSEGCPIKPESDLRTPSLSSIVKQKVKSAQRFLHSSEETCGDNRVGGKFSQESLESVVITEPMDHANLTKVKASGNLSKLDKDDPMFAGVKENKENELLDVNVMASTTVPTRGKDYKKQYKRNSSRSPLLRELTRLGFGESLPDFVSKDLRRRRDKSSIRVLFSQRLDDHIINKQNKILVRLGISVASDCSDATHFVTDRFVRTRNMLETMALGKPVVTPLWLENCLEAKCFVDEKNYILQDFKMEKELGFSMLVSLSRAKEHPLLKDQRVIVTPNVKPSRDMIESLVKKVYGQVVKGSQKTAKHDKVISTDLLVLSCEEDYATCVPFLDEGAAVYSSELLLNGIVIQKLQHERHRLFKDRVDTKSPNIHQKKRREQHVPGTSCA